MKKLNLLVFALVGLFAFTSCEEANVGPVYEDNAVPPAITSSIDGESFTLTEENIDDVALELSWSKPGVGFRAEVNYTVQMAASDTDFAEPLIIAETTTTSASMTVGELNAMLIDGGYEAEVSNSLDIRVIAEVSEEVDVLVSETVTIFVTPFPAATSFPEFYLYLVGDATSAGWDNNNNNMPLVMIPGSEENNFSFTGRFAGGTQFKLLENLGAWQPQWGNNGGSLASSDDLGGDPPAFDIGSGDGYYSFEVDIAARTFTLQTYDASSAATYATVGIIGSATPGGWDSDTDLTQSAHDPHIWYVNGITLVDGEAKFRANDAWDVNWGSDTEFSGFGTPNGPNIPVRSGTYNVWFNDITGGYMLIPVQ